VWWFTSVIPGTQEAIGRRIIIQGWPWAKNKPLSEKITKAK
jgi:hypothetical protein